MIVASVIGLLVLAAGVAVLSMIVTLGIHDALKQFHRGVLQLDTVFAHLFTHHEHEKHKHGTLAFFLIAWTVTLAFFALRFIPSFDVILRANPFLAAGLFGVGLYLAIMLVFLPVFRLGAFGRGYHRLVPYWGAFFVAVFVFIAAILVGLVL